MKKLFALSALSLALLSGTATASTGDIRFVGAVTDVTCNLVPSVNGAVNNVVMLGIASLDTPSAPVDFSLKSDGLGDCGTLADAGVVNITFGGTLTDQGLANQSGLATDAYVEIMSKNSSEAADNAIAVTNGSNTRKFTGNLFKSSADAGAQFQAQLVGQTQVGDYQSAISFVVAYM